MSQMATDDTALNLDCQKLDMDPVRFEHYCRELAEKWAKEALKPPYRIEYRTHEPIDILIEEAGGGDISGLPNVEHIAGQVAAPRHFIECKLYGRELGLNVVGASYLYALRERPRSLVIATNQSLTGGAREFASWLFNTQMEKTTKLCTWNPFKNGRKERVSNEETAKIESNAGVHRSAVAIDRWSLCERTPFQDIPVASSDCESRQKYSIRRDAILVFRAFLHNPVRGRRIRGISLQFSTSEHGAVQIPLEIIDSKLAGGLEIQGIIQADGFKPGISYAPPDLSVSMSGGEDRWYGMQCFPALRVEPKAIVLPDLRAPETEEIYEIWMRTNDTRILLIQGEGGAGKTYLCGRIAERAAHAGFRAAHTPLEIRSELAFITEIVWMLLSPDLRILLKEADRTLTSTLLAELGHAYGASITEGEASALTSLLIEGKWDGCTPEIILQAIARLVVRSNRPLLFIISNAHRISDGVGYGIRTLLGAIEAAGWGKIRLIVEARDTPEDISSDWINLKAWMANGLGYRVTEHTVRPLDEAGLRTSLSASIASTDDRLMASIIAGKSGGNPLFLRHLLQSLLEEDVLEPLPTGQSTRGSPTYVLPSISKLRTTVAKMGMNVEELLLCRIQFWDNRLSSTAEGWAGYVLGLMSILEAEVSVTLLATLTSCQHKVLEATLMSFDMAGLVSRRPDEAFCFSHEFAADAARSWLKAQTDVHARIAEVADHQTSIADSDAFIMALSKGRLHAFLHRHTKARDALNAALQLAGTNFNSIFRCRRDMHQVLVADTTGDLALPFHVNFQEYLNTGYYILPCEKNVELNKQALATIQDGSSSLSRSERKLYSSRYHHNLSNLALRTLDSDMFFEHSHNVLGGCNSPLDLARFLNRAIKICSASGTVGIGRQFGELASSLQTMIAPDDDPDLEAVLLSEMSFLYAGALPSIACKLAEDAFREGISKRQRVHNFFALACARLRLGEIEAGAEASQAFEDLVHALALKTMSPGVDMLHGILALFQSDWREAANSFRMGMADTSWLGNRREELRIGTNLVVARTLAGDMEAASRLNDALLSVAARTCQALPGKALEEMLRRVRLKVAAEPSWKSEIPVVTIFPETLEFGPHITASLLRNAETLHCFSPNRFSMPSRFGFSSEKIEQFAPSVPGQMMFCSSSGDLKLQIAC